MTYDENSWENFQKKFDLIVIFLAGKMTCENDEQGLQ